MSDAETRCCGNLRTGWPRTGAAQSSVSTGLSRNGSNLLQDPLGGHLAREHCAGSDAVIQGASLSPRDISPPPQKLLQLGLRASPGSAGNRRWERTAEGVGGGTADRAEEHHRST